MNVCFEYLYRDAGNNKRWGEVVLSNPCGIALGAIIAEAQDALIDGSYFIAEQAIVPTLYFGDYDPDLHHGWHEAYCFTSTTDKPTDTANRTVEQFIRSLRKSKPDCLRLDRLCKTSQGVSAETDL